VQKQRRVPLLHVPVQRWLEYPRTRKATTPTYRLAAIRYPPITALLLTVCNHDTMWTRTMFFAAPPSIWVLDLHWRWRITCLSFYDHHFLPIRTVSCTVAVQMVQY
jgi:hypothetical protein